jgi:ATP-binding cassette subfamily B protein
MTRSRYGNFTLYRRLARHTRSSWPSIAAFVAVGLLVTPLALLTPLPLKIAVDSVLGPRPLPGFLDALVPAAVTRAPAVMLIFAAALTVLIAVLSQLRTLASTYLRAATGERLVLDFRNRTFRQLQRRSLSDHDAAGTADSMCRIQNDAAAIRFLTVEGIIPVLSAGITLAAMVCVMIRMDWPLTLIAVAIWPFLFLVTQAYRRRLRHESREVKKIESAAMAVVHEALDTLRLVKAFGQEERERARFMRRANEAVSGRIRLASTEGHSAVVKGLIIAAGTAAVLFVGIGHVRSNVLSLGDLLLVMCYLGMLFEPIKTISRKAATLHHDLAGAERAMALLDEPSDVEEPLNARSLGRARGAIAFRGVSFSHGEARPVLNNVSFDIEAGTRLGIVAGAGKSTLINLLARFCDPTDGQILLDGTDIREYRLKDLRRQFAFVLQNHALFSRSIGENIAYGSGATDHETIIAAAQAANAHEFIMRLPKGYETHVGEDGVELSVGQRQRIALARAFLQDSPVLVLDEPMSAVEAESEAAIRVALRRLMRGRTVVLITQDARMLESCEALLALENGCIVADTMRREKDGRPAATQLSAGEHCPNLNKHPAVRAWLQLHPRAEPLAITPLRVRKFKNKVYRLEGAGLAGAPVIAKRLRKADAGIERTVYEEILARVAVPSLRFYGSLEDPDSEYCWLFQEDAVGVDYSNLLEEHRFRAGRWLGLLHMGAADASSRGQLPDAGPGRFLDQLHGVRELIQQHVENPVLSATDIISIDAIRARLDDLAARWDGVEEICAGAPQTLVHGDFNGKNMRMRSSNGDTTVVAFDWEDAGWGVPAVDLAQLAVPSSKLSANPDIAAYWSTVRERWPDAGLEDWRRLADCGTVFRTLSALHWDAQNLAYDWAHSYVGGMQVYTAEFDHALERLGWSKK